MRRNYSYWLVLWGAMLFGIDARGQEVLDTLWTLRFESPGNETIQGIKLDDDGNLIMIATHNGLWGTTPGRDFIKISPDMEVLRQRRLPGDFGSVVKSFREIDDGRIEVTTTNSVKWLWANDSVVSTVMYADFYNSWSSPQGWAQRWIYGFDTRWWSDNLYVVFGADHLNGSWRGNGYSITDHWLIRGSDPRYTFPRVGTLTVKPPIVLQVAGSENGVHFLTLYQIDSTCHVGASGSTSWPLNARAPLALIAPPSGHYLTTQFAPNNAVDSVFVLRHFTPNLAQDWSLELPATDPIRPFAATPRANGDIVLLGPLHPTAPFIGLRLDAFSAAHGQYEGSWFVRGGDSLTANQLVLCSDSTALVLATMPAVSNSRDFVLFHTVPIDYSAVVPHAPSVTLVYSDSTRWGYRLENGFFSMQTLTFDGLCSRSEAYVTGADSANWTAFRAERTTVFSRIHALQTYSSVDTFWITADNCFAGDVIWSCYGGGGAIAGPSWFPPVVGQFFIREESYGVSIRFEIQGQSGAYAIEVWRKPGVAGDSMIVGTVASLPGMYTIADEQVEPGHTYTYYPVVLDSTGHRYPLLSLLQNFTTDEGVLVPDSYYLDSPFPNPFNSATTFRFGLPDAGNTQLKVYDITGRLVETLFDGYKQAGSYEFHFYATGLASGIYIYSFTSGSFAKYGKVALVR